MHPCDTHAEIQVDSLALVFVVNINPMLTTEFQKCEAMMPKYRNQTTL